MKSYHIKRPIIKKIIDFKENLKFKKAGEIKI